MKINFDSIKTELLLSNNFNSLISAIEFFIDLESSDVSLHADKEIENLNAISIIDKLKNNDLNFAVDEISLMIKALSNFKAYILGDLEILNDDPHFKLQSDLCLPNVQKLIELFRHNLNQNGLDFRTR